MRAVIQRVNYARVKIDHKIHGEIQKGFLILLGIEAADTQKDIDWLCQKIKKLRIFPDAGKAMNLSLEDVQGKVLIVSQFTLHASTKKGNRPSFIKAARPEIAAPLYEAFLNTFEKESGIRPATGKFGAHMQVELCNDGPVTLIIDTKNKE